MLKVWLVDAVIRTFPRSWLETQKKLEVTNKKIAPFNIRTEC
jgi:hypothetical protein